MDSSPLPYTNIGNVRLTRNFELNEFLASDTAARDGIDNTPSEVELKNIHLMAFALQHLRDVLSLSLDAEVSLIITSGFRSSDLNAAVGGSETSDHRHGRAADFYAQIKGGVVVSPADLCAFIINSYVAFDQLIAYPKQNRVHLGFASSYERPRRQLLTKSPHGAGYVNGIKIG